MSKAFCLPIYGMGNRCLTCLLYLSMPRYLPNTRFSDCWGSAGNITFYHRDGKCFFKSRDTHSFTASASQLETLEVHRRALAAWREVPDVIKEQWRVCASAVEPHKPPFDGSARITGHNLFVSAYHGFATLGNEHVPSPVPWVEFPVFNLKFVSATFGPDSITVRFRLWLSGASDCTKYRVLGKIALSSPGTGCKTSHLRNYLGEETDEPGVLEFYIPSQFSSACQLHIRYALIDSKTGYRSQYRRSSILIV